MLEVYCVAAAERRNTFNLQTVVCGIITGRHQRSADNFVARFFTLPHSDSPLVRIASTSNMAAWCHGHLNNVTAPRVYSRGGGVTSTKCAYNHDSMLCDSDNLV